MKRHIRNFFGLVAPMCGDIAVRPLPLGIESDSRVGRIVRSSLAGSMPFAAAARRLVLLKL